MKKIKTFENLNLHNKKVLLRVDFNVPLESNENISTITDDWRIQSSLPTINLLLEKKARIIICTHIGRPRGKYSKDLTIEPIARHLSQLLKTKVHQANDSIGTDVEKLVDQLQESSILILENIRFYSDEDKNSPPFSKKLAKPYDVFINDAFGVAHRENSSTVGVTQFLPSYGGLLMEKEIEVLNHLTKSAPSPRTAIIGGAKIADKLLLLKNIAKSVDNLIVGGAMAQPILNFLKRISNIDNTLDKQIDVLLKLLHTHNTKLILPKDFLITEQISEFSKTCLANTNDLLENWQIVDIGPKSISQIQGIIDESSTIFWNGPMGIFEIEKYSKGTSQIAKTLAKANNKLTVLGGGSTVQAVRNEELGDKFSHISTGGGAFLKFLEGQTLPALIPITE
tara:strand:+ start:4186 stop:5373 length:1188 start_codon:yes stop_codon:yes gene_type:complete